MSWRNLKEIQWYSFVLYQKRCFRDASTNKKLTGIIMLNTKGILWKKINISSNKISAIQERELKECGNLRGFLFGREWSFKNYHYCKRTLIVKNNWTKRSIENQKKLPDKYFYEQTEVLKKPAKMHHMMTRILQLQKPN